MLVAETVISCFLSGLFAGLTLWGLARASMLPIIGIIVQKEGEEDKDE